MPPPAAQSPAILALLRGLLLLGAIEAVFYRLLPEPQTVFPRGLLGHMHASLYRAGGVAFLLAFLLATVTLAAVAGRAIRRRPWPPGLNGFIAVCLLCMAVMGLSAAFWDKGPGFAILFTLLALMAVVFIAMDGFTSGRGPWERTLMVIYCAAAACSAVSVALRFAGRFTLAAGSGGTGRLPGIGRILDASGYAMSAGGVLIAGACIAAFMAYADPGGRGEGARRRFVLSLAASGTAAALFAAACVLGPRSLSPLGPGAARVEVLVVSWCLFVSILTALSTTLDPHRRGLGYGLLLLVIAGYPLRIAYQDILMVLGAVMVFGPRAVGEAMRARVDFVASSRLSPPSPPLAGPPGESDGPLPLT